MSLFESGAILLYLAEKTEKLLPKDASLRHQTIQWLFFQMGGVGPMFGQFGHFYKYGKDNCDHPYPVGRYAKETKRLLTVLDKQLDSRQYIIGEEYTIADISISPWINCLDQFYGAKAFLELENFKNVTRWFETCWSKPASIRGKDVCPFPG